MKSRFAIALSLTMAVGCASVAMAAAPVLQWTANSPLGAGGNVYYGSVVNDTYYTGQNDSGVISYTSAGLLNSYKYGVTSATKSATMAGNNVYFAGTPTTGNVGRVDNWTSATPMSANAGKLEALASDGTYIYSNDYSGTGKSPISRYSISGTTLTRDWATTITGANRMRGVSYYAGDGGKVYAVDGGSGIWEMNASDGSGATKIISTSWNGTTGNTGYQAVRSGSNIYVVADNGMLYQYGLTGGAWGLVDSNDLGLGALYGVGINSAGNGIWVSTAGYKVSYLTTVPEPSSILALVSGLAGIAGFGIRRRRA